MTEVKVVEIEIVEKELDWSPVENDKIIGHLDKLKLSLSKIDGVESYKNNGKIPYVGFRTRKNRGILFVYLSKRGARVACAVVKFEGEKVKGSFEKEMVYKVTEEGFLKDGERVKLKTLVDITKKYKQDRGW